MEIVRRIIGIPRQRGEPWLDFYKRSMRLARAVVWKYCGGQLSDQAWAIHWRWAGHLARYQDTFYPKQATLWYDLDSCARLRATTAGQWRLPDRRRVWRWEEPVYLFCCLLYTSPSPRDRTRSRMPSSA